MTYENAENDPVVTVDRTFEILETIQNENGIRLTPLANELNLAKSTVHRHLKTLEHWNYVITMNNEYHIGIKFLSLGIHARNKIAGFTLIANKTRMLAEETGELCLFVIEEHGRGSVICREKGSHAIETGTKVGTQSNLNTTAAGKSILAHLPIEEIRQIINRWGLVGKTENTITNKDELFEHLERIRKQGYALNREERTLGVDAIGAPVFDNNESLIGSLCISGPSHRMRDKMENETKDLLLGGTNELELNITYT